VSGQPYKPFEPDWTVSPGEMLAEVLEDRGLSPFGLAGRRIPAEYRIDPETAGGA
jgi:hypothetical protein